MSALRAAPLAEPYSGPALLSGRAAAVFFHEVLGHRVEGQRQRGRDEGQTFTKKVNEKILPEFLSVTDDPTLHTLAGTELSGFYRYDDEGIPASRVEVVKDGILKNFLMGRLPVKNFSNSNGHGRAQQGLMPVGRQGNLIVTSSKTIPDAQLRARFIEEIKKQGKPYGLYFEDIQGGFTLTTRDLPQAFQVLPVMVWRVYADGRPDELVRGVDIVGTPLTVLDPDRGHRRHHQRLQRHLRRRIRAAFLYRPPHRRCCFPIWKCRRESTATRVLRFFRRRRATDEKGGAK